MSNFNKKNNRPKTILLTGGSSGIGYQAAKKLVENGCYCIIPCRDKNTSTKTLKSLSKLNHQGEFRPERISTPIVDLSDLRQVNDFCNEIKSKNIAIDVLILNAGLQYTGSNSPKWSKQGIELTIAVNHISHQYMAISLYPLLQLSDSPKLIITASEVHNPNSSGGQIGEKACLGDLSGLKSGRGALMINGSKVFSADKAYKDSKLCNLLFAKEFQRRIKQRGDQMPVIAWAPGLVIPRDNGGFFRYSRKYNQLGQIIFAFIARDLIRITESPEIAGNKLAQIAISNEYNLNGFHYYSNQTRSFGNNVMKKAAASVDANNEDLAYLLWKFTCKILGISTQL